VQSHFKTNGTTINIQLFIYEHKNKYQLLYFDISMPIKNLQLSFGTLENSLNNSWRNHKMRIKREKIIIS